LLGGGDDLVHFFLVEQDDELGLEDLDLVIVGDRVADALEHLLVALLEELAGLVELGLDARLVFILLGALEELGELEEGVATGLEDLGELVELDDEVEAADLGGLEQATVAADDDLLFLEVLVGAGLGQFFFGDDREEAEAGVDEGRLAVGDGRDVEAPDLGEDGVLLVEVLEFGFGDFGEGVALDGGRATWMRCWSCWSRPSAGEGLEFLLEAGKGGLVGDRQDDAGEVLAERQDLDDRTLGGFGRGGGGFGGGHVRVGLGLG
jgi:hypothetical protein